MAQPRVEIRTYTCTEESSVLFDYESKYLFQNVFTVTDSCDLVRSGNTTQILHPADQSIGLTTLLTIRYDNGRSYSEDCLISAWSGQLWRIVKELQDQDLMGYRLKLGDEIRLGKCVLKVKKLGFGDPMRQSDFPQNQSLLPELESRSSPDEMLVRPACRLCLEEEDSAGDPLLHPCKCTGSLKYIHLSCIQDWIKTHVEAKERMGRVYAYSWKPVTCEVCHADMPVFLESGEQNYDLFGVEWMSLGTYIVAEEVNESTNAITVHVTAVSDGEPISIVMTTQGRNEDCNITLEDGSVSRVHATVICNKGQFYLKDADSKYGTLIRLGKTYALRPQTPLSLQVDRSVVVFRIRSSAGSCFRNCFKCVQGTQRVRSLN